MRRLYIYILAAFLSATTAKAEGEPSDSTATWNSDPLGLQTVVVTATRTPKPLKDIPIVTRVITAEDIKKVDATNVKDILQQELPGLEFTYSMGHQVLNMGGYDGNNILFLIDGERMAGESVDNIDFSRLDMASIERIEIVKGAASTLYGSAAMGGVINIITKSPSDKWTVNVNSRYEGANKEWRHGASADFNVGKVNSLTTFQMTDADSLSLRGEVSSLLTAYANKTYNVKERLTCDVSDVLRLTGRAGYFFRERNSSTFSHERYRDLNYGVRGNWAINQQQDLEVAYSFDQYDKSDFATLTKRDVRDYSNRQNIGRMLYNVQMSEWHSLLTAGVDFMNDYLMSYQFSDNENSHSQNSYDAFVQWNYTPDEHLAVIGGLRYDYFSAAAEGMPTWKVAGMYTAGSNSFRLSYASGFRAPSLKELYMNFYMGGLFMIYGNENLRCETNHNFSFTWSNDGTMGDHLHYCLTATGYYNIFNNYITTATVLRNEAYGQMYTNVANQKIVGADANVQVRHSNGIGAKVSYAFVKNIVEKGQPDLTSSRPHSLTWRVDYDRQFCDNYGLNVALSGRFLSAGTLTEYTTNLLAQSAERHYDAYSLWKLALSQRFAKGITLNCALDNLFNYKPKNYYANSPVTIGLTASVGMSVDIDKLFK
ncbi:MAG: TonB-dependent receptor [Prevotellaceae bacterium]|nr:TonB-dependent receptor [Prevotellaceae bacterium]